MLIAHPLTGATPKRVVAETDHALRQGAAAGLMQRFHQTMFAVVPVEPALVVHDFLGSSAVNIVLIIGIVMLLHPVMRP